MIILSLLVIVGFLANALMDGIAFSKKNRDLNHLWHAAKYVWAIDVLLTGARLHRQIFVQDALLQTVVFAIISGVAGAVLWEVSYRKYRKIDWPDWA